MPPLSITSQILEDTVTLVVSGDIDLGNAEGLYKALTDALAPGRPVIVDLTGVGFMDSRGFAALVRAHHEAAHGVSVPILVIPSDPVARVFELAGADGVLPTYRDHAEALAALTAS
ncbi:STAS domain-containing protein [Actinospica sp.]|jgi:anti-anti-sigma factor|uniref:STAS domain-containing protein n=1 Tax=Actinospica sp. TaxID=1872142 RepID=UPI002C77B06B|nr:STAS domain-containing protein [Actinospica sp.]HWG22513.1 STAS domain-containing protein [Actinospica sp.]